MYEDIVDRNVARYGGENPRRRGKRNPARTTPRAKRQARKLVRRYGRRRARKVAGAGIVHARLRRQRAHFERVRKAVNPKRRNPDGKLYIIETWGASAQRWQPFAASHSRANAVWLAKLIGKNTGHAVHVID